MRTLVEFASAPTVHAITYKAETTGLSIRSNLLSSTYASKHKHHIKIQEGQPYKIENREYPFVGEAYRKCHTVHEHSYITWHLHQRESLKKSILPSSHRPLET